MEYSLKNFALILMLIPLSIMTLAALSGNILVILAVCKFTRLRSQLCFHVLAGLAIADICVSLLVMPWSMTYLYLEYWPFGEIFCKLWMSCDVMCCTASILHLCVVAFDRYLAIAYPLHYKSIVTICRIRMCIVMVWMISGMISFFPIQMGWYKNDNTPKFEILDFGELKSKLDYNQTSEKCELQVNALYAIISSSISFYIPFCLFFALYSQIFCITHRQVLKLRIIKTKPSYITKYTGVRLHPGKEKKDIQSDLHYVTELLGTSHKASKCFPNSQNIDELSSQSTINSEKHPHITAMHCDTASGQASSRASIRKEPNRVLYPVKKEHDRHINLNPTPNEFKAIKTVGLLLGFFTVSWLPFFLAYLIIPVCGTMCYIPPYLMNIFIWIGYANSAVNPILYGFLQRDFREAFFRLVHRKIMKYSIRNNSRFVSSARYVNDFCRTEYLHPWASVSPPNSEN